MNIGEGESHSRRWKSLRRRTGGICAVQPFQRMTVSLFVTPHEKVCYPLALLPLENAIGFVHNATGLASGNDA